MTLERWLEIATHGLAPASASWVGREDAHGTDTSPPRLAELLATGPDL